MEIGNKVGCGREEITGIGREGVVVARELSGGWRVVVVTRELSGGWIVEVEETDDDDDDVTDKEVSDDETTDEEVSMVESVNVEEVEETGIGVRESRSWLRRGYAREEEG